MDEHTQAKDKLWALLQAEPKPIDRSKVLEIASLNVDSTKFEQFKKWFEKNGDALIERLANG